MRRITDHEWQFYMIALILGILIGVVAFWDNTVVDIMHSAVVE